MSTISAKLRTALDVLGEQVTRAEAKLRRMPGSRSLGVYIEIKELCPAGSGVFLMFGIPDDTDSQEEKICIQRPDRNSPRNIPYHSLPISQRILAAERIPDLIDAARAAEVDLAERALEAANSIEHRLSTDE